MTVRPSILCPIDYSDASAAALRYAAAIAEHFVTRLIVLSVEDPLLTTAMDLGTGIHWTRDLSEGEIAKFVTTRVATMRGRRRSANTTWRSASLRWKSCGSRVSARAI